MENRWCLPEETKLCENRMESTEVYTPVYEDVVFVIHIGAGPGRSNAWVWQESRSSDVLSMGLSMRDLQLGFVEASLEIFKSFKIKRSAARYKRAPVRLSLPRAKVGIASIHRFAGGVLMCGHTNRQSD